MACEERESDWEVGPTKDVIQAFIKTLVDPKFPSIENPPSEDDHKAIARQMHAVVLVYNYYHRKQKPELDFLDFVPFCKLALSIRSEFKPFMSTIDGSEAAADLSGCELSLTERAVKGACDIAKSLDASKDFPITEGYPISTVAVLLTDSETKNCLLQAVTEEGVWSLIEKEVDEDQDIVAACEEKQQPLSDHSKILQAGFDVVKDVAGIKASELEVLEAHVVYSLSKEKSGAQFYIMRWNKCFDPIRRMFILDSLFARLWGPLALKTSDGSWVSSGLVKYHRLLPYSGLISNWLQSGSGPMSLEEYEAAKAAKCELLPGEDPSKVCESCTPKYKMPREKDLDW